MILITCYFHDKTEKLEKAITQIRKHKYSLIARVKHKKNSLVNFTNYSIEE